MTKAETLNPSLFVGFRVIGSWGSRGGGVGDSVSRSRLGSTRGEVGGVGGVGSADLGSF